MSNGPPNEEDRRGIPLPAGPRTAEGTIGHSDGGAVAAARPVAVGSGPREAPADRRVCPEPVSPRRSGSRRPPAGRVFRRSAAVGGERGPPIAFEAMMPKLEAPLGASAEVLRANHADLA